MTRGSRALSNEGVAALTKLKEKIAGLSDVEDTSSYGNPAFKVGGKPFAILDKYKGGYCLWILVDLEVRQTLLEKDGWFPSPYDPRAEALCCRLEALDWRRLGPLLRKSHDLARRRAELRRS